MKLLILIWVFISTLLLMPNISLSEEIVVIDSLMNRILKYSDKQMRNNVLDTYHFAADGDLDSIIANAWHDEKQIWLKSEKFYYQYNTKGQRTLSGTMVTQTGDWIDRNRATYTYNSKGYLIYQLLEFYSDTWRNGTLYTITYNEENKVVEELETNWYNEQWEKSLIMVFSYDSNGNLVDRIQYKFNDHQEWDSLDRWQYQYDDKGNDTSELYQKSDGSLLKNVSKLTRQYDSDSKKILEIRENWNGTSWTNSSQTKLIYTKSNLDSVQTVSWNGTGWVFSALIYEEYDENRITYRRYEDDRYDDWLTWKEEIYKYKTITDVEDKGHGELAFGVNYPNPVGDFTILPIQLEKADYVSIDIVDLSGKKVKNQYRRNLSEGMHQLTFDLSDLSPGAYFFRIRIGNQYKVKSFIKE